jgi:hypothetical protein
MIIDKNGCCSVDSNKLNELLQISGKHPIVKEGENCKYKVELTDEDKIGITDQQLSEAYHQCEETRKIISEWTDKRLYNKYKLDRWKINE